MELRGAFVLAMIAFCHCLAFPADGRPVKLTDEPASVEGHHGRPRLVGHRLGRKQVLPPPMPSKSSDFGVSVDGYKDDFRPTTPGNSPGAGHSFGQDDEETEQKPAGRVSSINGDKEGFRPTNPGHSPGGGHAFVSKRTKCLA